MSTPAWLLDAIHATESACVPTVPNPINQPWEQMASPETHINKGVEMNVPNVPTVPKEIGLPQDAGYVDANGSSSIRDSKPASHAELQRERRRAKVLALLGGKRFALFVDDDKTDPVIATVGIRDVATFELAIPRHSYDGMVLLELIEKHYGENYANN